MTQAVIQRLRRLEGLAIITPRQCIRAERYVERHLEFFSDATKLSVSQAVDLALESAALTIRRPTAGTEMRRVELQLPLHAHPGYTVSIEIIKAINLIDGRELATMLRGAHGLTGSSLSTTGIDLPLKATNSES